MADPVAEFNEAPVHDLVLPEEAAFNDEFAAMAVAQPDVPAVRIDLDLAAMDAAAHLALPEHANGAQMNEMPIENVDDEFGDLRARAPFTGRMTGYHFADFRDRLNRRPKCSSTKFSKTDALAVMILAVKAQNAGMTTSEAQSLAKQRWEIYRDAGIIEDFERTCLRRYYTLKGG